MWGKTSKVRNAPGDRGKTFDLFGVHVVGGSDIRSTQNGVSFSHGHDLSQLNSLLVQGEIESDVRTQREINVIDGFRFVADVGGRHGIRAAGTQTGDVVPAIRPRSRTVRGTGWLVNCHHVGTNERLTVLCLHRTI